MVVVGNVQGTIGNLKQQSLQRRVSRTRVRREATAWDHSAVINCRWHRRLGDTSHGPDGEG